MFRTTYPHLNCDWYTFQINENRAILITLRTIETNPKNLLNQRFERIKEKNIMKIRGFELVSQFTDENLLPRRETAHAAGYDLKAAETVSLEPGEIKLVPTGVKAYMQANEVLYLYDRSSNPRKKGLVLINSVGVIDGDYYGNPANEGHIFAQMRNITEETVVVEAGERIVQAVFAPFLLADGDQADGVRTGGFGSTGK